VQTDKKEVFLQQQQSFYGPLSWTTRVSRYQKKHSPNHHPNHHPVFISFFHLLWSIGSSLFKLRAWQSSCTTCLHVLFGVPLFLEPEEVFKSPINCLQCCSVLQFNEFSNRQNMIEFACFCDEWPVLVFFADGCAQFSDNVWSDASPAAGQQHLGHGSRQCWPVPCRWKRHQSCMSCVYISYYLYTFLCTAYR